MGRDGDAVAVDQIAVRDDVAHVDGDAETDPPFFRHVPGMLRHPPLDRDRAAHGIDDAVKLDQQAIAHSPHDPAPMRGDLRIDKVPADASERRQGAFLVNSHEPGIAEDVGAQDNGKPVLYPGIGHFAAASRCATLPAPIS